MRGEHAAVGNRAAPLLRLQHHGAGAVAEEHAGGAVGPVEDAREGLRPDDQRAPALPGPQHRVGVADGEDEAGADRLQVEGRAVRAMPSASCTATARRREGVVGRRGRQHDQVDVGGREAGIRECAERRLRGQVRRCIRLPRRCGARGCRCAGRSIRPRCRPSPPGRRWSAPWRGDSCRSRGPRCGSCRDAP